VSLILMHSFVCHIAQLFFQFSCVVIIRVFVCKKLPVHFVAYLLTVPFSTPRASVFMFFFLKTIKFSDTNRVADPDPH
jgi:hypothetical protein